MDDRISQETFGRMISRYVGREKAITGATVSRWEADEAVPDIATIAAVASLCGLDPGWLAFGSRSGAPTPEDRWKSATAAMREASERAQEQRERQTAHFRALVALALRRDRAKLHALSAELRELNETPGKEARKRAREVIREMHARGEVDRLGDLLHSDPLGDRDWEEERRRRRETDRLLSDEDDEEDDDEDEEDEEDEEPQERRVIDPKRGDS
jgi:hypothetical protein